MKQTSNASVQINITRGIAAISVRNQTEKKNIFVNQLAHEYRHPFNIRFAVHLFYFSNPWNVCELAFDFIFELLMDEGRSNINGSLIRDSVAGNKKHGFVGRAESKWEDGFERVSDLSLQVKQWKCLSWWMVSFSRWQWSIRLQGWRADTIIKT